jgi:hypothetical protein
MTGDGRTGSLLGLTVPAADIHRRETVWRIE